MRLKLLPLFLIAFTSFAFATNDTLTRAQVYNFNVGDTFDYEITSVGPFDYYYTGYQRVVITSVDYSLDNDTLFLGQRITYPLPSVDQYLTIPYLKTYAVYFDSTSNNSCSLSIATDSNSIYNNRLINNETGSCLENYFDDTFAVGLGTVYDYSSGFGDFFESTTTQLIFYSKSGERWGTPLFSDSIQPHYTPIPEECAVWTDEIFDDRENQGPHVGIREQIRSGSKSSFHSHTYVEMIYRSYDYETNYFTDDSLIGYYRNDTVNHQALFYQNIFDTSFFAYNFDSLCPEPNCISNILIGGQQRRYWGVLREVIGGKFILLNGFIEGVGGTASLIGVKQILACAPYGQQCTLNPGHLTCFSVCGEALYTSDSTSNCSTITGIQDINLQKFISIYPTINSGNFAIVTEDDAGKMQLQLYDILGRTIQTQTIYGGKTEVHIANAKPGIYLWTVSDAASSKSGKIIIQ